MTNIFGTALFGKTWLQRAAVAIVAASLSGCFDDGSGADSNNGVSQGTVGEQPQPAPTNRPPDVSGTPAATATVGEAYYFEPKATDPDGDFVEYTITNQPVWATFDTEFGILAGTPSATHVDDIGDDVVITVTDGKDTRAIGPFNLRVRHPAPPSNHAPTITGTPQATARVGELFSFRPVGEDADGDVLHYVISNSPSWTRFDSSTGELSGTPSPGNIAPYSNIVISVNDGYVTTLLPAFSLQVLGPANQPPTISGPATTTVQALQLYTFIPSAIDPDGDTLTYSILNRPRWATFSTTSGRLSGTPRGADVGTFANIRISASDGRETARLPAFSIDVTPNRAPTISGTPATAVTAGSAYSFTPNASDPDNNSLTFSIQNTPSWASFNATTGRLSGTPAATVTGTFSNIIITVRDGELSASLPAFAIRVNAPTSGNQAPTISGTPATSISAGAAYNFQPSATDANGDRLTYSIASLPTWATFDAATGRLSGTPSSTHAGTYANIVISVSDGRASVSLPAFTITVSQSVNGSATLSWTPPTQNTNGSTLTNLAGYRIVYGRASTNLDQMVQTSNAGNPTYMVTGLASGRWYFAVKAYNSLGEESDVSNVGTKIIP